uniref:hypothetical protein n=1 Tax=Nocardia abscessus TaxID=120957 RepID=UPI002458227D
SVAPWVTLLLVVGAARFGSSFTRRVASSQLSLGVQHDLRRDLFAALLAAPPRPGRRPPGPAAPPPHDQAAVLETAAHQVPDPSRLGRNRCHRAHRATASESALSYWLTGRARP